MKTTLTLIGLLATPMAQAAKTDRVKPIEVISIPVERKYEAPTNVGNLVFPIKPSGPTAAIIPKTPAEYSVKGFTGNLDPVSSVPKLEAPGSRPMPTVSGFSMPDMKSIDEKRQIVENYSDDDLRLFDAYVLMDDVKKPLAAYGSFSSLLNSKKLNNHHVKWGLAKSAGLLGLRMQFENMMMELLNNPKANLQTRAFDALIESSDPKKSVWVQSLTEDQMTNPPANKNQSAFLLLRAARYSLEKNIDQARRDLAAISKESSYYGLRVYREAILMYREGRPNLAFQALTEAFEKTKGIFDNDEETKTKAAMLWGRLAFQNREFNRAFEAYRTVPKTSPLWPEAMTEQALSQILYKDYEGAAGNMFSLHTDFFKKSYSPDSYIIRSVGYLNLCQFADAHKVVEDLVRKYKPILAGAEDYSKKKKNDYDTIREFAKAPQSSQIQGLARPFLFAWAQDPSFERHQERINQVEDELSLFKELNLEVVKKERELATEVTNVTGKINQGAGKKEPEAVLQTLQDQLAKLKLEYKLITVARKALAAQRDDYFASMEKIKDERKILASKALHERLQAMTQTLKATLDQADVLLYEIYNGAGDHIRFEAAGGKIESRQTAALKGTSGSEQKWQFKGEVWEDEVGHYRSSLTNICPKDNDKGGV